jgi:precorrin-2 dehydrogenase/sirohydrochlorin ferrochelatase
VAEGGGSAPYPVNLVLDGLPVLVVGGGRVALGKVVGLVEAGARVTVVAPEVRPEVEALGVEVRRRPYEAGEAAGYRLVVAAVDDPAVAQVVHDDAEAAGIFVNSADDPARCSFTLPSRLRRGDLLVTVSTGGRSPALAAWLRRRLEAEIGPEFEQLLELLAGERDAMQARGEPTEISGWRKALESGMLERLLDGDVTGAQELLRTCLSSSSA